MEVHVRSWFSSVLRSILIPFSSGKSESDENENDVDEEISPTLTFAHLVSCLCVVLGIYSGKQTTNDTARFVVWGLVMGLVSCGVLALFVLIFSNSFIHNETNILIPKDYSLNLRIIFLWIFGLSVILHSAVNLAITIECFYLTSQDAIMYIGIISTLMFIFFIILQIGTITYFRNYHFKKSTQVNFAIVFLSLANFAVWFNSVVSSLNGTYSTNPNATVNMSTFQKETECFFSSKIQTELAQKLLPFLLPARMEFFILASSFILSFWHSSSEQQQCEIHFDLEETGTEESQEILPLLPRSSQNRASNVVVIMISVILNLPTFLTWLLLSFVYTDNNEGLSNSYEICNCINSIATIIIVYIAFDHLSKTYSMSKYQRPLTTSETILVFSSAGVVAYSTYGLLFGLQGNVEEHLAILFRNFIEIIETFLQTSLLIQCQRYILSERKSPLLSSFALILTITNLINWFLYSIYQNVPTEGREKIVGNRRNWAYVQTILVPLLIFYRFTSALNSYSLYQLIKP
ncbi:uncharacterized protein LOC133171789 [Saccostrea echinata]|uniref:uncharacterized protein LOC133171789 n=1 Tax=Saccostrea echinata TaxID=191078 RepID=UPI002A81F899|nr:uncharacterized protein LOC133171789 [Saccostrea echinata]